MGMACGRENGSSSAEFVIDFRRFSVCHKEIDMVVCKVKEMETVGGTVK
jgi:hypothetical protein